MRHYVWGGLDVPITQRFGVNPADYDQFGYVGHNGLDLGLLNGTRLYAATDGTVAFAGNDPGGYGWNVYVLSTDGGAWICAHMTAGSLAVALGDVVSRGEYLGLSDNTGNSTGPHLHFGRRPPNWNPANGYGGWIDPLPWLVALQEQEEAGVATIAELEAKIAELNGTNNALAGQVRDLEAEIRGLNGVNTTLEAQRANCEALKQEVESQLRAQLEELQRRFDAIHQTSRSVVHGNGTMRIQYSDEQYDEVEVSLRQP